MMTDKREFILEGLGCANCAAKMEAQLRLLPGGNKLGWFGSGTLAVETQDNRMKDPQRRNPQDNYSH